jgi:hypothetical protein
VSAAKAHVVHHVLGPCQKLLAQHAAALAPVHENSPPQLLKVLPGLVGGAAQLDPLGSRRFVRLDDDRVALGLQELGDRGIFEGCSPGLTDRPQSCFLDELLLRLLVPAVRDAGGPVAALKTKVLRQLVGVLDAELVPREAARHRLARAKRVPYSTGDGLERILRRLVDVGPVLDGLAPEGLGEVRFDVRALQEPDGPHRHHLAPPPNELVTNHGTRAVRVHNHRDSA